MGLEKFITEIDSLTILAAAFSALLTVIAVLSAIAATTQSWGSKKPQKKEGLEELFRSYEIKWMLKQEKRISRWAGIVDKSATTAQIIIGVVLASKIADNELQHVAAYLGIFLLISSLLVIAFKPDIKSQNSKQRALMLKNLLRDTEDSTQDIYDKLVSEDQIPRLRKEFSARLTRIEAWGSYQEPLPPKSTPLPP